MAGISNSHRIYTSLEDKKPGRHCTYQQKIDAVLITQLSKPDSVLLELEYKNIKFFAASMYLDITKEIERKLEKIDRILELTKGIGLIIAVDRNARSAVWHDTLTNKRGKTMEYIIRIYIMKEESEWTTFNTSRGSSIDHWPL